MCGSSKHGAEDSGFLSLVRAQSRSLRLLSSLRRELLLHHLFHLFHAWPKLVAQPCRELRRWTWRVGFVTLVSRPTVLFLSLQKEKLP
jgi:hypothetical protein